MQNDNRTRLTLPGLMISAPWRSSGKTMVSVGLAGAARRRKLAVQPYKKGPDYIDPLWLAAASGAPCYNLDPYTQTSDEIRSTFHNHLPGKSLALIEGTMGLHDGLSSDGSDSNAAIAKLLNTPVLLVVDCRGMHRTVAALINGIQLFDADVPFAGVILNRIRSDRHLQKIRRALLDHSDAPLIGSVPDCTDLHIDERELGLVPAPEHESSADYINAVANILEENCDLDSLFDQCPPATQPARAVCPPCVSRVAHNDRSPVKIGVCRDAAFHFYYQDDLDYFRQRGVVLIEISPLTGVFPTDLDGLLIGGGFPERYATLLADNEPFRLALRVAIENGLVVHAECAGLMYLCRTLWMHGEPHPMVGVIGGEVEMQEKPLGRGYMQLVRHVLPADYLGAESVSVTDPQSTAQSTRICAHEFHYSKITFDDPPDFTYGVKRGFGIDGHNDGVRLAGVIASYAHFRHTQSTPWIDWFLQQVSLETGRLPNSGLAPEHTPELAVETARESCVVQKPAAKS